MGVVLFAQQALEVVDARIALGGHLPGHQVMHARDQHVFIVRAIENADPATGRRMGMDPPKKIVRKFLSIRLLETGHFGALRIQNAHHVVDGAVLSAGVQGLNHHE